MAITFKYGAPGPILQAGFAAGVANRQKKQQEDALEIWERQNQQEFQAGQAAINRQFQFGLQQQQFGQQLALQDKRFEQQSLQDLEQRTFQAGQADLGRKFQAEQTKGLIDARAADSALDRDQRAQLLKQQQDFAREQVTLKGLQSGELELPPEAQNRLRQLESGRVDAMRLDPIQQQEFMEQYESEKSILLGLAQPAKQPTVGEQFAQSTIEKDGTLYQRGKDGGFDVLREAPEDTFGADMEKYSKLLQAEAIRLAEDAEDTEGDLSPYIDQAKKNLAGVGFARPARDWGDVIKPQQIAAQPQMAQGTAAQPAAQPPRIAQQPAAQQSEDSSMPLDMSQWPTALKGKSVPALKDLYRGYQGDESLSRLIGNELESRGVARENAVAEPVDAGTVSLAVKQGLLPAPKTKQERDALPSGAWYLAPDGRPMQKK